MGQQGHIPSGGHRRHRFPWRFQPDARLLYPESLKDNPAGVDPLPSARPEFLWKLCGHPLRSGWGWESGGWKRRWWGERSGHQLMGFGFWEETPGLGSASQEELLFYFKENPCWQWCSALDEFHLRVWDHFPSSAVPHSAGLGREQFSSVCSPSSPLL